MNRDFVEMLHELSVVGAEFLVVGAHALAAHDYPRATGDLDLFVHATPENAQRVWSALAAFGAPMDQLTVADLQTPETVFQLGLPPARIDILTSITGVTFEEAWPNRKMITIAGEEVAVIGIEELIRNKRATGRPQDLVDAAALEKRR